MEIRLSDHFTYPKLFRFVWPSVIMMVFTSIYGVVDGFFISNFAGKTAFAAINLIMPFAMILGGMGFMVGTGGTALVSKVMGQGDMEKANRYFSMTVLLTVSMGAVHTVLGIVLLRPVALLFGATEDMLPSCLTYGRILIGGTAAFMLQNVFQAFFSAAEKPHLGLVATVAAGVTNMVLDALFVGVFRWGVAGAAAATVISQCVGGIYPLIYFLLPNSSPLRIRPVRPELRPMVQACANGSSELMSNISISIVSILYNLQLLKYFGENGVSAYGVLMYVQMIFIAIFIGYSIGCAPIVGYHYGAENHRELKNLLRKSTVTMGLGGILMALLAYFLASPLARLFVGYDDTLCALTVHAFRLFSLSFLLSGCNIFASSFFTALNNGAISAAISFLRTLVMQSACVLLLPLIIGVDGVWWAMTAAEVFAFAVSLIFLLTNNNRYGYL